MNHLADIFKAVTNYEQKLKHKHKKISQINVDKVLNSENASCVKMRSHALFSTQCTEWDFEIMYLKLYNLYELKLSCISFCNDLQNEVCFRILINFWVNYIIFYSISYFFYFWSQLICWTVKFCCAKSEKHFNEN